MRRPDSIAVPLTVELTAAAWRQIGALSSAEFTALREHLDLLAAAGETEPTVRFRLGEISGVCERDLERRVLRVVELVR